MAKQEIEFSELPKSIAARLVMAQKLMKQPPLDSENPHFHSKFSSLSAVTESVLPALNAVGLFLYFKVEPFSDTHYIVKTIVVSDLGDEMCLCEWPMAMIADAQKQLALSTYIKRGSLLAAFSRVGDTDLDMEVGQHVKSPQKRPKSFVAACSKCGARYTFESKEQMLGTKCCDAPQWKVER